MKTTFTYRILVLAVLLAPILSSAKSLDRTDPWPVLNAITHKHSYTIETRDRKCAFGTLSEVAADHITADVYTSIASASPDTVIFPRADVLRVAIGSTVYYSGRSSWSDVSSLQVLGRERLMIVMKNGKTHKVKSPYTVSDDGITVNNSRKLAKISKGEIAQVYAIVMKPLTNNREYFMEELGPLIIFDPDLYAYGLHLEQYVRVLLYDDVESEDDSSVQCMKEIILSAPSPAPR